MQPFSLPLFSTFPVRFLARLSLTAGLVAFTLGAANAHAWGLDDVASLASQRAQTRFQNQPKALPAELANLNYDEYRDIRFNRGAPLWRANRLPYEANFFHVGREVVSVRMHEIVGGVAKPMRYNPSDFNFGKNKLSPQGWGDLGYGGLRIFSNLNTPDVKDELTVFQGASYFRALGSGQRYGLSARGLAVDTVGAAKEEFPRFTDFWLERPAADAKQVIVYALLDSERMTGAYRFDITPGENTTTEVHARIFMRPGQNKVATFGVAPLTSMFYFGEKNSARRCP